MNKLAVILFFTLIISTIGCTGHKTLNNEITGTLYVAGNEPFTYLALESKDRTVYKIECADSLKKDLWKLQGKTLNLYYDEIKKYNKLNIAIVNGYSVKNLENKD